VGIYFNFFTITVFAVIRSKGQVKLDLDKWKLWKNFF